MTRLELIMRARKVVKEFGGQVKAADTLGVKQGSISKALKEDDTAMEKLRIRILVELGGYTVSDEPYYIVQEPAKKRKVNA